MRIKTTSFIFNTTLVISVLFFSFENVIGQTGAGGVGNASNLPMWYDANEINLTNGSPIAQVDDISGNNNHLTQATATRRPVYTENVLNGLPVMTFDGVNDFLTRGATAGLTGTNFSYFIVFKRTVGLSQSLLDVGYSSEISKWTTYSLSNNRMISLHRSPTAKFVYHIDGGQPTFVSTHITSSNISQYRQGILQQSLNTPYTAATGHNLIRVGAYNYNLTTGYFLNGYIAEIIVYNSTVNNLEKVIIENYLGAKYNLSIPTDLYAFQNTHNVGLIALGNNGTNSQTTARGYGMLELSSPSDLGSNEYLMVARTNDPLTDFTLNDVPVSLSDGSQRWTRTWRAGETGDVGDVTLVFDLSGGNDFGDPAEYRLLVDNTTQNGDFSDATIVTGTYNGGMQTMTFTLNLASGDYFTLVGRGPLAIHSVATGNWSDPNTWDCICIPTADDSVFIEPSTNVTVDVDAFTDYFSVESSGTLTMPAPVTLNIGSNWDIAGTLNFTDGEIAMVGDADQYVDAGGLTVSLNDLEINNTGGVVTFNTATYLINGVLTPTLGTLSIAPGSSNQFIINSTSATSGGRIAPIGTSFTFTGEFVVRRFLPAGVADYRDLASPVAGATLAQWDASIPISGVGFPDGCAFGTGGCYYSCSYYVNDAQVDVTSVNDVLTTGRGYEIFIGDDETSFGGATLSNRGTLNDGGNVVINVSANYSTVGNPYASPISFPDIALSGVANFFYVYDPNTGNYEYYDDSDGSSSIPELANGLIAIGQGFWVYGPGSLTVSNASKTTSATFVRETPAPQGMSLVLTEDGSTYSTSITVQSAPSSLDMFDGTDIPEIDLPGRKSASLSIVDGETKIRKNYIQNDWRNKSFMLYTKILNEGYYTLTGTNVENFDAYLHIYLFDHITGDLVDLKSTDSYTFYSEVYEGQRFSLIYTNEENSAVTIQTLSDSEATTHETTTITQMGHTFNISATETMNEDSQIRLVNVLGQTEVYSSQMRLVEGSNMITVPAELKGVHILVIATGDKLVTKKVVL